MTEKCNQELREFVDNLKIVDSHEHLPGNEKVYLDETRDVFSEILTLYNQDDLISSGMSQDTMNFILDTDKPVQGRYKRFLPWWKYCQFSGYGRMVKLGLADILGVEIGVNAIEEIAERFQSFNKKGIYKKILQEKSGIEFAILDKRYEEPKTKQWISGLDNGIGFDREIFKSVYRLDYFVRPESMEDILLVERLNDISINSLDDWKEACEKTIDRVFDQGVIGIKSALAYMRNLTFEQSNSCDAEKGLLKLLEKRRGMNWRLIPLCPDKAFQDHMFHFILSNLNKRKTILQIHTGIQAGNINYLKYSDPIQLSNLFILYPDIKFDIFHIGFPFQEKTAALAKMFPNLFIDLCWAHIISPGDVKIALQNWVEMVPVNKIIGFGGDLSSLIFIYGHQKIARDNISFSLSKCVENGIISLADAKEIARLWLYENPKNLYKNRY